MNVKDGPESQGRLTHSQEWRSTVAVHSWLMRSASESIVKCRNHKFMEFELAAAAAAAAAAAGSG